MCGIAGVVSWDENYRVSHDVLRAMSARVAHRGPDGEGLYLNHDGRVSHFSPQAGLIHRRLSIIDLDERSLQPFDDGRNRLWLTYNGEIYNYLALRHELSSLNPDYVWRTTSDTEVLLVAYQTWGEHCLEQLNGMYAFAIWDQAQGTLFLARDRMGQKPLFFTAIAPGGGAWKEEGPTAAFAFSSELAALRTLPWFDRAIDFDAVCEYLRWGYVPAPSTIYQQSGKVPPGSWARIGAPGGSSGRYFDPNLPLPGTSQRRNPEKRAKELVLAAVQKQLVADVPVGCFLSGGIDSSIVAAAMKQTVPASQSVLTFSIGFDDPRYDETKFAEEVARHLGTKHQQFMVRPDAAADLPQLAQVYGEPFGDSSALPTHYLSRETAKHVKVALSGDGGDELFCGYDRYRAMSLGQKLARLPGPLRLMLRAPWWRALPGHHPKSTLTRAKRLLQTLNSPPAERYGSYMRLFDAQLIDAIVPREHRREDPFSVEFKLDALREGRDLVTAAMAVDRITYLPDDLLVKVDHASMLHALEVRSPFMDHAVVHFAAGLSAEQLLGGTAKRVLRDAFAKELPATVFSRKKMGFAVPIGDWFRAKLGEMLRETLFGDGSFTRTYLNVNAVQALVDDHQYDRADHSQRLYALLMLELWWRGQM